MRMWVRWHATTMGSFPSRRTRGPWRGSLDGRTMRRTLHTILSVSIFEACRCSPSVYGDQHGGESGHIPARRYESLPVHRLRRRLGGRQRARLLHDDTAKRSERVQSRNVSSVRGRDFARARQAGQKWTLSVQGDHHAGRRSHRPFPSLRRRQLQHSLARYIIVIALVIITFC